MRHRVWSAIAPALCMAASAGGQEVWWGVTIPTRPRVLVLHGEDLWRGAPQDFRRLPSLTIDGVSCPYIPDGKAPGNSLPEANFSVSRVLQFAAPDDASGDAVARLTTNDGRVCEALVKIGPHASRFRDDRDAGVVQAIGAATTITGDWDAKGATLRPSEGFADRWLVRLRSGTIRNLRIEIPPSALPTPPQWGLYIDQDGDKPIGLENVSIVHGGEGGAGVYVRRCHGGAFSRIDVAADYCFDAAPNGQHGDNVWHECRGRPSHWMRGQMGRGLLGERNLAYRCCWVGLDRGPVSQSAGPPQYQTLLYRCDQDSTGATIGGSEGILWEAPAGRKVRARIIGGQVVLVEPSDGLDDRVGLFVWHLGAQRWARITARADAQEGGRLVRVLGVAPDLPPGEGDVVVGNGAVRCTIAHCTARSGCRWVFLFCRSADCAILGGDVRSVYDAVTWTEIDRPAPASLAFCWRLRMERVRISPDVVRPVVRWTGYDASRTPTENLPWYREAAPSLP